MERKPRIPKRDRLVTWRLIASVRAAPALNGVSLCISFSYLEIGLLETVAAFLTYFWIMRNAGIAWSLLFFNLQGTGISEGLLRKAQSSYFFTIVLCQIGNIFLSAATVPVAHHWWWHVFSAAKRVLNRSFGTRFSATFRCLLV